MDLLTALPNHFEVLAIIVMATVTYSTRIIGYALLSKVKLSKRIRYVLEASPCCVMISIATPYFITSDLKMLSSLGFAVLVALKFNFAVTVIAAVAFNGLLHHLPFLS